MKRFKSRIYFDLVWFSSWQLWNERIPPSWPAQTWWTQLQGENEGKGQQNLQGQELRWLLTRQSSQPRRSKQVLNVFNFFLIFVFTDLTGFVGLQTQLGMENLWLRRFQPHYPEILPLGFQWKGITSQFHLL